VHGCDEDEFEGEDVPVVREGGTMSIAVSEARKAWSSMETRAENASSRMGLTVELGFSEDAVIRGIGACEGRLMNLGNRNTNGLIKF
jgi:hypothetical protein